MKDGAIGMKRDRRRGNLKGGMGGQGSGERRQHFPESVSIEHSRPNNDVVLETALRRVEWNQEIEKQHGKVKRIMRDGVLLDPPEWE